MQGTMRRGAGADAVRGGHGGPAGRDAGLPGHVQPGAVPCLHGRALRPPLALRAQRHAPRLPQLPAGKRLRPLLGLPAAFCLLESVQSLECALTCSLRPLLRARLLKRGFVRDARQEGGTRGAGVQVHRAYQPYEVTKPNSLRKADLIRLSLCAGGRIRRSPERRWRGLPGRGRIRRARRRAGRGPRRAAGRQVPGLQRARRAPAPPLRILACLVACMGACL